MTHAIRRRAVAIATLGVLTFVAVAGCSATALPATSEPSSTAAPSAGGVTPAAPPDVPSAREGAPARSERVHFVPEEVQLPGKAHAAVIPAATVNGVLKVPEEVRHVGWWDGSAYAGDPFGSTVIAGHVDSATEGLGFFARLRRIEVGDHVTVSAGPHHLTYRIVAITSVDKDALASDSRAFNQKNAHRLVLITCTGNFRRDQGGYESNLVVIGKPIGLAR